MKFDPPLHNGVLKARYKRFFADVELEDGRELTVHCPNTGAMTGCSDAGLPVRCSLLEDEPPSARRRARKLPGTLELVRSKRGWVYVNTTKGNRVVAEALAQGVDGLDGYAHIRPEVTVPGHSSRFDFLLSDGPDRRDCVVEVKSVSWAEPGGLGLFPDAKSTRATRHVNELATLVAAGEHRCTLLFAVVHAGIKRVQPAETVDPEYAQALRTAAQAGVEVLALGGQITGRGVTLNRLLPVEL